MAKSRIKGITVEIGGDTTGLNKALSGVNKEIRDTQSELKDVERLLKMDPKNVELTRQKYNLLNKTVEQTEEVLKTLKTAEKQAQEQFKQGKISQQQYDALKREIIETEQKLDAAKKAVTNFNSEAKKGTAEKEFRDAAEAAEDIEGALKDAKKEASNFADYLKAGAILEGTKAIVGGLRDVVEEAKEYQKIMGSLEISSERAGYSAEETASIYDKLYGVLGDNQTAATTTANLQAVGVSQKDLIKFANAAIGAWATYGDSIPIDGLSEAINETIKTGTVTGALADVLNWAGVSEDDFNAKLEQQSSASERANTVLQQLASQGLVDAGQAWQDQNQNIIEANNAQGEFEEKMAEFAERVQPIVTAVQEGFAAILDALLQMTENVDFEAIAEGISNAFTFFVEKVLPVVKDVLQFLIDNKDYIISAILGIAGAVAMVKLANFFNDLKNVASGTKNLMQVFPKFGGIISGLATPVGAVGGAVVGLVALIALKGDEIQAKLQEVDDYMQGVFARDWKEVLGPEMGGAFNTFLENTKVGWDALMSVLNGVIDIIRGVFTGDWERAWNGVKEVFAGVINAMVGIMNAIIGALNWLINQLNKIQFTAPDWVPFIGGKHFGINIPNIPEVPYMAKGGILSSGSAVVGEAGPELLTMMGNRAMVEPLTNSTTNNNAYLGGLTVNVYGAPGQNVRELAQLVSQEIEAATERTRAVYR